MKKKWERPELIVLAKSRPAEMVLQTCKVPAVDGPGATGECIVINVGPCLDNPSVGT